MSVSSSAPGVVVIQKLNNDGSWSTEYTKEITTYYDDNDSSINNGQWSKNYGGIRTTIRPILIIFYTNAREYELNTYIIREQ